MATYKYEDGEYERREYQRKLLADDFAGMTVEECEEELAFFEHERIKRKNLSRKV